VLASRDDGKTWTPLRAPGMSPARPTSATSGPAYTGSSGGESPPRWIDESIDLGPYAGSVVSVAFWSVADDAVTRAGVALDDVRVGEIGYGDDAESDQPGWDLNGWARVGSDLPQLWNVAVVTFSGDRAIVERVPVDAGGH